MKNLFVADFETTTDENDCRVWGWGLYDILEDASKIGTTIDEFFFDYLFNLPDKSKIYFHNLKFDGEFLFYFLFKNGFKHSTEKRLYDMEFSTLISYMGVFYAIGIKYNGREYTIYDSLKIIPLSVKEISKAFNLTQLKGEIDYKIYRPIGHVLTDEEKEYIKNDIEIVGKALTYFFDRNLNKMTQASNAMYDFKKITGEKAFETLFPKLESDSELRQSYRGGFTYANPKFQGKVIGEGIVLDVNSLYPSVMYFEKLPYGEPIYYEGEYKPDKIYSLYIQMFRCNFELKEGHIPTLQLKGPSYKGFNDTEYVTSSNNLDVTLCLTSVDLDLFFKHYDVYNLEYFHGWKFKATDKLFKGYIDKWIEIKEESTVNGNTGLRTIAKLMLNALYGKFGLNANVKSKIPWYDGEYVHYKMGDDEVRDTIYVGMASFITAYARKITISAAQNNIERFVYADTDSLHLIGLELPKDLNIDNVKLGYWKHEGNFINSKFLRAKSYLEEMFISKEDWEKLKPEKQTEWKYNKRKRVYTQLHVARAGLPKKCHALINFENFKNGMTIGGKLQHKRVKGGVILKEVDFTLKVC